MGKYDYPLPMANLTGRYGPFFTAAIENRPATLFALPHTGRTSMLRFILSDRKYLSELGCKTDRPIYLIDPDKSGPTYTGYLKEIYRSVLKEPPLSYMDDYDLARSVFEAIRGKAIILILGLNETTSAHAADIDRFAVMLRKENKMMNVVWSVDVDSVKSTNSFHSSSSIFANTIYFPTFDKVETFHCVARHFLAKGIKIASSKSEHIYEVTGGVSGLFHPYVDSDGNLANSIIALSVAEAVLNSVSLLDNSEKQNLINDAAILALTKLSDGHRVKLDDIEFALYPTSQEINIIKCLKRDNGYPVCRDSIAHAMWGKAWESRYSDWAIDKTISRLRSKIVGGYRVISVRNGGYRLEKLL